MAKDKPVRVWPVPRDNPTEYVPGIPTDGIEVSPEKADALLASGLVTTTPPPDAAADKPEKGA